MKKYKLQKIKCLRCQYEWTPRVEEVRTCAKCGSAYWDQKRDNNNGIENNNNNDKENK